MKKVMVFGTFDIFHKGHENFLRQAKKYGDYLIVIVARDQTVSLVKNKLPLHKEKQRLKIIKNSGLADLAILGRLGDKYGIIKKYSPDVICLGYDQKFFIDDLSANLKKFKLKTKIIRLKPFKPELFKSSKLINRHGKY